MKWVFRLGYVLIPFLFFLMSPSAYPHARVADLSFLSPSRGPASLGAGAQLAEHRNPRLGEYSELGNLKTSPVSQPSTMELLSENLRENAQPVTPQEGNSGIGVKTAVIHF